MVAVLAVAFLLGKVATIVLFALVSFLALREFLTLVPTKAGDYRALSLAFFVLIPVQYYLIGIGWYALFSIFIPVYGFLLLPSFSVLAEDPEHFLERSARIQWGVMVTIYCISHVPALLLLDIPGYAGQNALLLFYMLLVVQISDVLQYVFGKMLGRTKIAPVVSPSKTVEGFVGGAIGATLIGAGMWWITPFTPLQAAGMAAITVLMGFLGGLVLSAVKRSLGAKDWGTMIQGHGGMMDRMDSVSFAAPIFFHLTRYFFTP
jgi:phosphatidate cytidylyltransferase